MSAIATKQGARKLSASVVPHRPFWYAPSLAARAAILEALAAGLDPDFEDDDRTSDAHRVATAARSAAEEMQVDSALCAPSPGDAEWFFRNEIAASAFDVRALLTAALKYPGQKFCAARAAHLEHARRIADTLAILNMSGPDQSMVAEVYAAIEHRLHLR